MGVSHRRSLEEYLAMEYPFQVIASVDGGYVIRFPDLPGCVSQTDDLAEVGGIAEEIRTLWIETEYEAGADIPLPSCVEGYSGKFNLRLPRSLHRKLAESADQEGVSLNQYVTQLLARGDAQAKVERQLETLMATMMSLETQVAGINERLRPQITSVRERGGS
jgi:predicted RNase H-like HicB family nuclease